MTHKSSPYILALSCILGLQTNSTHASSITEDHDIRLESTTPASPASFVRTKESPIVIVSDTEESTHEPYFPPLVAFEEDGLVFVNKRFEKHQATILTMNTLSYSLIKSITEPDDLGKAINQSRRDDLIEKFMHDGWTITPLSSKVGFNTQHDDIPGFVAYHAKENLIVIIFHGSANDHDWETNFDFIKIKATKTHLPMAGKVHRGFALKYASIKTGLENELHRTFDAMREDERNSTQIIVSGHSHGGSIASLATTDLAGNFLKQLFPTFDNARHNRLYGYFVSPPCVGDSDFKAWSESVVGKENIISHFARHDVVANLLPGVEVQQVLQKIPAIGQSVAKNFAGYEHTGTIALEDKKEVLSRFKDLSQDHHDADASFFEKIKQTFYKAIAALHFGSNKENKHEYIFDEKAVGSNLSKAISQGENYNHQKLTLQKNGSLLDFILFSLVNPLL
ncbi:MAG: lipase family protein [Candidatus Nucleicultricaceae bacterium]